MGRSSQTLSASVRSALRSSRRTRRKEALEPLPASLFLCIARLGAPIETCTRPWADHPKPFQQVFARLCARAGGRGGRRRLDRSLLHSFSALHGSAHLSRRVLDHGPIIPNPSSKCSLGSVLEQEDEEEGGAWTAPCFTLSLHCTARRTYRDVYSTMGRSSQTLPASVR